MTNFLTIPNFERLSKQELFDISARHILSTRVRCTTVSGCSYQKSGCAAAPFLRPDKRVEADTFGSWMGLFDRQMVPSHEHDFVWSLQRCHDSAHSGANFMSQWRANMSVLASAYNLSQEVFKEYDKE